MSHFTSTGAMLEMIIENAMKQYQQPNLVPVLFGTDYSRRSCRVKARNSKPRYLGDTFYTSRTKPLIYLDLKDC